MVIGLLTLQGCVEPHAVKFNALGVETKSVRQKRDLQGLAGLVIPGGESTTISSLISLFDLEDGLRDLAVKIRFWGICAGSIIMAQELKGKVGPHQLQLGLIRAAVERNSYGRQLGSFHGFVKLQDKVIKNVPFIRAPEFLSWDDGVEVLCWQGEKAVYLKDGIHMVNSFHP